MQVILSEEEYMELKEKADGFDTISSTINYNWWNLKEHKIDKSRPLTIELQKMLEAVGIDEDIVQFIPEKVEIKFNTKEQI